MKYKAYRLGNLSRIPRIGALSEEETFALRVVGQVFPFKSNNYVVENLIDWDNVPADPMFVLNFPQKGMLRPQQFDEIAGLLRRGAGKGEIQTAANRIRWQLNPHPSGQLDRNVPAVNGERLSGVQHKYRETVLFFPGRAQTCHAYCSFCFRWPQFAGIGDLRFAAKGIDPLIQYVSDHKEVTDILFTGGDPMVMKGDLLAAFMYKILQADLPHIRTIRIGTKALSYWPYRFTTDDDASLILEAFRKVCNSGRHLAVMAHFSHPRELSTVAAREAIGRIRDTGAEIRTQSPLLRHINDDAEVWAELWSEQVRLSCIPYYMFVVRDTGAQHYFGVPLVEAWEIFTGAYKRVSGLARTVRGPSMSVDPGKVQILGVTEVRGKKVIALDMIQGRDSDWVHRPFFAEYDERAIWLDELRPAFGGDRFFFEVDDTPVAVDEPPAMEPSGIRGP
jgi:KamA family protein